MDTADRILDDILACMAGPRTPEEGEIIDYLTFCNYKANRERGMTAADLAKLWPQTGAAMEQRYWDEINAYADKMVSLDRQARHEGRPEHDLDLVGRILKAGG